MGWAASDLGQMVLGGSPGRGPSAPGVTITGWAMVQCGRARSRGRTLSHLQIDYYCRLDCLWKKKFKKEHEEFETMESVNRLLLENVLPAHVAAHFIGDKLNEVRGQARPRRAAGAAGGTARVLRAPRLCREG